MGSEGRRLGSCCGAAGGVQCWREEWAGHCPLPSLYWPSTGGSDLFFPAGSCFRNGYSGSSLSRGPGFYWGSVCGDRTGGSGPSRWPPVRSWAVWLPTPRPMPARRALSLQWTAASGGSRNRTRLEVLCGSALWPRRCGRLRLRMEGGHCLSPSWDRGGRQREAGRSEPLGAGDKVPWPGSLLPLPGLYRRPGVGNPLGGACRPHGRVPPVAPAWWPDPRGWYQPRQGPQ